MRAQMTSLDGAFKEGARAEEALASRSAPMRNGLRSKATGGSLYEMQPVISSAHLHRQARMGGNEIPVEEELYGGDHHNHQSSNNNNASPSLPLVGLLAFGVAAALAIVEHDEISERMEGLRSLFKSASSTQCDEEVVAAVEPCQLEKREEEVLPGHIAAQPVYLQRQR